jgi:hypothetical protein
MENFIGSLNNYLIKVFKIGKHNVQLHIVLWIIHGKLFNFIIIFPVRYTSQTNGSIKKGTKNMY